MLTQARLAQLQQQQAPARPGQSAAGGQSSDERKAQEEQARQHILAQILEPAAADRLGRIRLVKESRATDLENRLIMLARTGQLRSKVSEAQLKEILAAVADNERKEEEKIVISRRKGGWDDDDDDDDLLDL
ncbi:DNA-binding TFAR19-related protein [Ascosphaera apis ARSEF 7405]|uniref:DNA-binding TFAR19-related protein n=1 Tax=Ascosphaera apis ARSEF 7405 TaxID=392613 RepID=A0A167UVS6_9EURO|nr:DNA-binding TFAR19-related protein [Ascosphaera apis ARSEF 7405]